MGLRTADYAAAATMLGALDASEVDRRTTFRRAEAEIEAIFGTGRYDELLQGLSDRRPLISFDPEVTLATRRSILNGIGSCRRPRHVDIDRYARCSGMVDRLIGYASQFARFSDSSAEAALNSAFQRAARLLRSAAVADGLSVRSMDRLSRSTIEFWDGTVHGWPGTGPSLPGLYSFPVRPGARSWMHKLPRGVRGEVELSFYARALPDPHAQGVSEDVRTEMRHLDVDGTPVTIVLDWSADTDPTLVDEARGVIDSIVAEPTDSGHRLVFRLPGGWDSG